MICVMTLELCAMLPLFHTSLPFKNLSAWTTSWLLVDGFICCNMVYERNRKISSKHILQYAYAMH